MQFHEIHLGNCYSMIFTPAGKISQETANWEKPEVKSKVSDKSSWERNYKSKISLYNWEKNRKDKVKEHVFVNMLTWTLTIYRFYWEEIGSRGKGKRKVNLKKLIDRESR